MNAQDIKNKLLELVPIGTEYIDSWDTIRPLKQYLERETGFHLLLNQQRFMGSQTICIDYLSYHLVWVSIKKQKGSYNRNSYSRDYHWFIKDYVVEISGDAETTLEDQIKNIKKLCIASENKRVDEINKNVEFTKKLMSLGLTLKEIKDYVQYMDSWTHRHEVFDKIEKGE